MVDANLTSEIQEVGGGPFKRMPYHFQPGHAGGPGRPPGCRNKLSEVMISDLYHDWQAHGAQAIEELRQTSVVDYVKIVALLVSKCDDLKLGMQDSMRSQELEMIIEERRRRAALAIEKMRAEE